MLPGYFLNRCGQEWRYYSKTENDCQKCNSLVEAKNAVKVWYLILITAIVLNIFSSHLIKSLHRKEMSCDITQNSQL